MEEFPGDGPVEPDNPLLQYLVNNHQGPISEARIQEARHKGVRYEPRQLLPDEPHIGDLHTVADYEWGKNKAAILAEMWKTDKGFDPEFYASKNTFQADALKCFSRHGRPKDFCIDWEADSRKITGDKWKGAPIHLCMFCPVASTVMQAQRKAKGYYDKLPGEGDIPL